MKHVWERLNINLKYIRKQKKKVQFVPKYIVRKVA